MATPYPEQNFHTQNILMFAKEIEQETGGQYKIKVHSNASLLKMPDIKRGVQTGQAALGEILTGMKIRARQGRLDKALPDILDLFVISMDAGLSLNAAMNRVTEEIRGVFDDFFDEFQIAATEMRTGINWDEAFENLAKRTGVQSIRSMVSLMVQAGKMGGSIGDALRHHAEFTRTQRILRAEEQAGECRELGKTLHGDPQSRKLMNWRGNS